MHVHCPNTAEIITAGRLPLTARPSAAANQGGTILLPCARQCERACTHTNCDTPCHSPPTSRPHTVIHSITTLQRLPICTCFGQVHMRHATRAPLLQTATLSPSLVYARCGATANASGRRPSAALRYCCPAPSCSVSMPSSSCTPAAPMGGRLATACATQELPSARSTVGSTASRQDPCRP